MVANSWNEWLQVISRMTLSAAPRTSRRRWTSSSEALECRVVLTAPVANPASYSIAANTTLNGHLTGFDADGDPLVFHTVNSTHHGSLSLNSFGGDFTYTPFEGFNGTDVLTFIVNDGTQDSAEATVTITVGTGQSNSTPTANPVTLNTNINTTLNGNLSGSDPDGDTLTFAVVSTPAHGSVTVSQNGAFSYSPDSGYTGNDSFTFKVNDGTQDSSVATVSLNVTSAGNTTPVAHSGTFNTQINTTLNGTLTGTDADGDSLTYSAGSLSAAHGSVNISPNGAFTYVPTLGYSGNDMFSFKVNDGTTNSSQATVTVHVVSTQNTAPVANSTTITIPADTAFNGTLTGTDADGDSLLFQAGSTTPQHGTVSIGTNGTYVYTPTTGFSGNDHFSFRVNDGLANSSDALVTVHVGAGVNSPPVATAQTVNTNINTTFNGNLAGTDSDGDSLTFTAGSVVAAHGTATISPNGTFSYVPTAGYTGNDTFSFKVNDGTVNSPDALVTVHVNAVNTNTPPTVTGGTGTVAAGSALTGSVGTLGSDANGDPLTYATVSQPTHGTLTMSSNGAFIYTPTAGFSGNDFFTFRANDGTQNSNVGIFTITVTAPANPFVLNLSGNAGTISTNNKSALPLDSGASIGNVVAGARFANAAVRIAVGAGADSHDRIDVSTGSTSTGNVEVRGKRVLFNGNEVARLSGGTKGHALQIDFNSSASANSITAVLQRVTVRTTKRASREPRTVQIHVNAGGTTRNGTVEANVV